MKKLLMSLMWYLIINSSMAMHHGCPTSTINAEPQYVTAPLPYFPEGIIQPPSRGVIPLEVEDVLNEGIAAVEVPEQPGFSNFAADEDVAGPSGVGVKPEPSGAIAGASSSTQFPRTELDALIKEGNAEFDQKTNIDKVTFFFDEPTERVVTGEELSIIRPERRPGGGHLSVGNYNLHKVTAYAMKKGYKLSSLRLKEGDFLRALGYKGSNPRLNQHCPVGYRLSPGSFKINII